MNFTSHDIVLIEKSLHTAIQYEKREQTKQELREVLQKLQASSHEAMRPAAITAAQLDGLRYDYDDSSDLQ
jgi:arsenate reductase-like glutaredoxin family protein